MKVTTSTLLVPLLFSSLLVFASGYGGVGLEPLLKMIGAVRRFERNASKDNNVVRDMYMAGLETYSPVFIGDQEGLMEADKIDSLPGQPDGVDFDQYSGYVTVDDKAGRALFYYFTEAPRDSASKPLVLWLNGGPGCSSLGAGAMSELGPFRVNSDGTTLYRNKYAWNTAANIIFLESPAGVGYSYSNTTSDYDLSGDNRTAIDSYTFLVNWLERFPQYKLRDLYIAGESYAGHYAPQLAYNILLNNKMSNQTSINLRGVAIGNGLIDDETTMKGYIDFHWSHDHIPDEVHEGVTLNCNFSDELSDLCKQYLKRANYYTHDIFPYEIYAPLCNISSPTLSMGGFDPCSDQYIDSYLNLPQVQKALHVTSIPYSWSACSSTIQSSWNDWAPTILPIITELMKNNIRFWIYSGDTDGIIPSTSTRYSINALNLSVNTSWYPWYIEGEVGGYAVGYQKLVFATVRGSGHFVPSYQPARAFTIFTSFLSGRLPPRS